MIFNTHSPEKWEHTGLKDIVSMFCGDKSRPKAKAAPPPCLPQISGDVQAQTASCAFISVETMRHACHSIQDTRPEQANFGQFSGSDVAELICSVQPERNLWPVDVWITQSRAKRDGGALLAFRHWEKGHRCLLPIRHEGRWTTITHHVSHVLCGSRPFS